MDLLRRSPYRARTAKEILKLNRTILVVDDDPRSLALLTGVLSGKDTVRRG